MSQPSITELTFDDLTRLVEAEKDKDLLKALDLLLSAVIVLLPVATGSPATWALIEPKNELVKIGRQLVAKLSRKRKDDFIERQRRIAAAHLLVCYTAFFDAASKVTIPLAKQLDLASHSKAVIFKEGLAALSEYRNQQPAPQSAALAFCSRAVVVPHPVGNFGTKELALREMYEQLAANLQLYLGTLPEWDAAPKGLRDKVTQQIKDLPQVAVASYTSQYFTLAVKYPEFLIWGDIQHHKETEDRFAKLSESARAQIASMTDMSGRLDIGFGRLETIAQRIPGIITSDRAQKIAASLSRRYHETIAQRVIDDRYVAEDDRESLSYPRKYEIFIPQAFKVLRYDGPSSTTGHLEDEALWEKTPTRQSLGAFLMSYLTSPYSIESPLMILGHPGSGKSLLTEILAARLADSQFNTLRVPLRDINAEAEVRTQLQDQISRDARRDMEWAEYSESMRATPPVVILDGFDELLQASGKVHAHYLERVHEFQRREAQDDRPVRIIATSRITLIDKAALPRGCTVLRLDEFDEPRRKRWIEVWNANNQTFFQRKKIKPFAVPKNEKIIELSWQPLLLLMLALFDSESNQLRQHGDLDQTLLYNSLLRRFIERERLKGESSSQFRELTEDEQEAEVDADMRRLGVAAMSMFNRRTLHIQKADLDRDIEYFNLQRAFKDYTGRLLSQAELLLGSFFFIHESKSGTQPSDGYETGLAAFEFLHNTFGEFLTADFILSHVIAETITVSKFRADPDLELELDRRLSEPDKLPDAWFSSLSFTPLYTRPVIVRMIREWGRHILRRRGVEPADFISSLNAVVTRQIRQLLAGNTAPSSIMTGTRVTPYDTVPLIGHYATYSLNLIILITMLSSESYVFDETRIPTEHEGGPRPWDQLTNLWRSWLAIDDLSGLAAIMESTRDGTKVVVRPRATTVVAAGTRRLETIRSAASAIGDDVLSGLAGLHGYDALPYGRVRRLDIRRQLAQAHIDLELEFILRVASDQGWPAVLNEPGDALREHLAFALRGSHVTRSHRALLRALINADAPMALRAEARRVLPVPDLAHLVGLPAGYATDLVQACAALEPRWIEYALRDLAGARLSERYFNENGALMEVLRIGAGLLGADDDQGRLRRVVRTDRGSLQIAVMEVEAAHRYGDPKRCERALLNVLGSHSAEAVMELPANRVRAFLRAAEGSPGEIARWLRGPDVQQLIWMQPLDIALDLVRLSSRRLPDLRRYGDIERELYIWPEARSIEQNRAVLELISEAQDISALFRKASRRVHRERFWHLDSEVTPRFTTAMVDELPVRVVRRLRSDILS